MMMCDTFIDLTVDDETSNNSFEIIQESDSESSSGESGIVIDLTVDENSDDDLSFLISEGTILSDDSELIDYILDLNDQNSNQSFEVIPDCISIADSTASSDTHELMILCKSCSEFWSFFKDFEIQSSEFLETDRSKLDWNNDLSFTDGVHVICKCNNLIGYEIAGNKVLIYKDQAFLH